MALIDLPLPRATTLFDRLTTRCAAFLARRRGDTETTPEEARERRAFVQSMLARNPEAFSCGEDVTGMMAHFPGRF